MALVNAMMRDKSYQATALGPAVMDYLAWKSDAAAATLDQYERDLRLVCLAFPDEDETGITWRHLAAVQQAVPEGSRRRCRAAWSDFFKWAVREGLRPDNPVDRMGKLPKKTPPVYSRVWNPEELGLLVAGTRGLPYPLLERLRVLTMIRSGARAGELRGLQLKHFDIARKTVTVTGKGNKQRLVPISSELARLVDEHFLTPYPEAPGRDPLPSDYLWFPTRRARNGALTFLPERPVLYGAFYAWWRRVEDAAGFGTPEGHRKPHMTRHTFATATLEATEGDIYAVQELLGHESVATTQTYLHSEVTRKRSATDKLDALWNLTLEAEPA